MSSENLNPSLLSFFASYIDTVSNIGNIYPIPYRLEDGVEMQ